jgi:hypothetical protein
MSEQAVHIKIKINYPVILFTVILIHTFLLFSQGLKKFPLADFFPKKDAPTTLKIRRVKTAKVNHPLIHPMDSILDAGGGKPKGQVSLKDLSLGGGKPLLKEVDKSRPGKRPEVVAKSLKSINTINMKSRDIQEVSKSFPSGGLSISEMISDTQKINDAVVSIEVPEGIKPDELNKYELMFYSFQKRTAINYIHSIIKNLNKFQKENPRYKIPSTGNITMTARITYDSEGNVMQIKMMRWTQVDKLQHLFEDIVKSIDQLHNPPKALWKKDGEFSMFYTLEILNG